MNAAAAGVSGEWSGTLKREGQEAKRVLFILKQNLDSLTGTAGPGEKQQWPIVDGKVDGNKLTGAVDSPEGLLKLVLAKDGDRIQGEIEGNSGGQVLKGVLDLSRVK